MNLKCIKLDRFSSNKIIVLIIEKFNDTIAPKPIASLSLPDGISGLSTKFLSSFEMKSTIKTKNPNHKNTRFNVEIINFLLFFLPLIMSLIPIEKILFSTR